MHSFRPSFAGLGLADHAEAAPDELQVTEGVVVDQSLYARVSPPLSAFPPWTICIGVFHVEADGPRADFPDAGERFIGGGKASAFFRGVGGEDQGDRADGEWLSHIANVDLEVAERP